MPNRLSPIESIIWRVGYDPDLRMTIGNLMILHRAPSLSDLSDRLVALSKDAPQLQSRPRESFLPGLRYWWVKDADFEASLHLRRATVPPPGDIRQVLDMLGLIEPLPFEPDRSPWDVTLIDGLAHGKAALYFRAHHVLTDGMGGAAIVNHIFDESKPPPAKATSTDKTSTDKTSTDKTSTENKPPAQAADQPNADQPNGGEAKSERDRQSLTVSLDLSRLNRAVQPLTSGLNTLSTLNTSTALATAPADALVRGLQFSLDVASSVSHQALVTGGPLATWPDARSVTSRFEILSFPGARSTALALGGSRSTLLVAAAASGLGLYLERQGQTCHELRLATPASLRDKLDTGGNWFAPLRVEVPTAMGNPAPQFGVVGERLARARNEPAVRITSALAMAIGRMPNRVLVPALHAQADTVDFAATAMPGGRGPHHICGALVEQTYPFGPRLGCPINVSAFGNDDRLDIGVALDPSAVTDAASLLDCLQTAYSAFLSPPAPGAAAANESEPSETAS
jgi:diacylglycerol O-acyltransferase / wax synthase